VTAIDLSIVPMPAAKLRAYLRGFADWYAEALGEVGYGAGLDEACGGADALHDRVAALIPGLDADGMPAGSTVFDILVAGEPAPVGATWCGPADFGFGPILYIHDLRVFAPFRRKGYAREALATIRALSKARGHVKGVGLSVLARNTVARDLYLANGFVPISQVLFQPS